MKKCLNCMEDYPEEPGLVCPCCGFDNETAEQEGACLFPGSILQGRYIVGRVQKLRDEDAIYIGWDALFERKVQIQEYLPAACGKREEAGSLTCREENQAAYQAGLERFYRRSRELIRLYQEEDIVTYHACFPANGTAYAIMDYREEKTLGQWLKGKQISQQDGLYLLQAACQAAEKVHRIGGYHGRIDADAFWMTSKGHMILKDFGGWTIAAAEDGKEGAEERRQAPDGISRDVRGLAGLFLQIVSGKEIRNEDQLEAELAQGSLQLSEPVLEVMRAALSGSLNSLEPLQGLVPDCKISSGRRAASAGPSALREARAAAAEEDAAKAGTPAEEGLFARIRKKRLFWIIGGGICVLALAAAGLAAFGLMIRI